MQPRLWASFKAALSTDAIPQRAGSRWDGREPAKRGRRISPPITPYFRRAGLERGKARSHSCWANSFTNVTTPQQVLDAFEEAVNALTAAGATVIDLDAEGFTFPSADGELLVLCFDFRRDVMAYFATRMGVPVAGGTLQTAIDFNNANADIEMPFFNQDSSTFALRSIPALTLRSLPLEV